MNSAEKPYEHLSFSEKEIFNICGEIIKYRWGYSHGPELLKLRERATDLFAKMRKVDISEHDSYYKLIAEANELKKEFEKLKNQPTENKLVDIDLDKSSAEDAVNIVLNGLANSKSVRVYFDWIQIPDDVYLDEEEQVTHAYDDVTVIDVIRQEKSDKFKLFLNETFNHGEFTSIPHIKAFREVSGMSMKNGQYGEHEHEGLDIKDLWLYTQDLSLDEVQEKIKFFFKVIKDNPRLKKE